MTAVVVDPLVDCIDCGGEGFRVRRNTGPAAVEEWVRDGDCTSCAAVGVVAEEWVGSCAVCEARYWVEDGCSHQEPLCNDCRAECDQCVADSREDDAYESYREAQMLGDASW